MKRPPLHILVVLLQLGTLTSIVRTQETSVAFETTTDSDVCVPECPSKEAIFANPRDCESFFKCADWVPFLIQCPDGQWYDSPNERCDYPENVDCIAGPDTPCVAVTNPPVSTVSQGSSTTVEFESTTEGETCVPPCPSDEAIYPNPRDCSTFFQCANGVPYLMSCPPGQEYSLELERCDYPEVAQCTAGPDEPCIAVTNPPS